MKPVCSTYVLLCTVLFFFGCGHKDMPHPGGPAGNTGSYFFANTEWTGVANTYGQTYPQPFYLRFNGDSTVSVNALFSWFIDNQIVGHDSTTGKITNIDTTNGMTSISVSYPLSNDNQIYTITDKNTLSGGSIPGSPAVISAQYTVMLQLNPKVIPSVNGTSWNTDKMSGGPTNNMYEFPDISGISFIANNKMTYTRNGKTITYTPPTQDQLLIEGYLQDGPKMYFARYNEESDVLIQYFGVLSADGKTIFADTRNRQYGRIPNYLQTIYWYGSPGVTPVTHLAN